MLASLENASGEIRYLAAVKGAPETLHAMVRGKKWEFGNGGNDHKTLQGMVRGKFQRKMGKNGNLGRPGDQNGRPAVRGRTGPEPVVRGETGPEPLVRANFTEN